MRVTTVIENLVYSRDLVAAHGLSLFIEVGERKILFDCGESSNFIKNGEVLNLDLKGVESVIISHNHWDHSGGLESFLELNSSCSVYYRALNEKFLAPNQPLFELGDGLSLVTFPLERSRLKDGTLHSYWDEQYLIFESGGELSLITGCSHRGIVEIINLVEELTGEAVVEITGGLHTSKEEEWVVEELIERLNESSLKRLNINHCTGVLPFSQFRNGFKGECNYPYTGYSFNSILDRQSSS